jgi:hypothetical protein
MKTSPTFRAVNFALTVTALVFGAGSFAALMLITLRFADPADGPQQTYLLRMAQISAVLLALCLILLAWTLLRHLRLPNRAERTQTPYVDAWAEAGRRFRFDEEDDLDVDNDDFDVPIEFDDWRNEADDDQDDSDEQKP